MLGILKSIAMKISRDGATFSSVQGAMDGLTGRLHLTVIIHSKLEDWGGFIE